MFTLNCTRHIARTVFTPALLGGLMLTTGLAFHSVASAAESPPVTLPPGFTIPPPSDPVITVTPGITIPPTSGPVITLTPDVTIPPTTDPVITLPADVTIVPDTTETTVPQTAAPTTDPAQLPPPPPPPPAPVVPSAPQSVTAKPGASSVTVTWFAPASNGGATIDKYRVQRATNAAGPWTDVGLPTSTTFTNNTGLTVGVKYYYRVRAHNVVGWSPWSTVVSATPYTFPSAPLYLVATPVKHGIKLIWDAPLSNGLSTIVGYHVAVYTVNCATKVDDIYVLGSSTLDNSTTYSIANGTARCFKVQASNSAGYGPLSNWSAAMAGRPTAPAPCSMSFYDSDYGDYYDFAYLSWSEPASYGGYSSSGFYGSGYRITITNGQVEMDVTESDEWYTWDNTSAGTWWAEISAVNSDGEGLVCTTNTVTVN